MNKKVMRSRAGGKMSARLAAGLLAVLLCLFLSGCEKTDGSLPEAPETSLMADSDFPRLDGSTATIPLGKAVYQYFTGASDYMADAEITFSKTDFAYHSLISGYSDLLLVYEGADRAQQEVARGNVELEQKEIGMDALVFLTSEDNSVDSLSLEDIRKIYSGEYHNWSQVGGEVMEIAAYQRNEDSGSQALMKKLVMNDTEMAEPERIAVLGDMGGLIEAVAEYRNDADALGYSVYYYASSMYAADNVKLLAVDGVIPSEETIADGTYPLSNPFFAIIRAAEEEDSSARTIYDFLSTEEGKALIRSAGYVSVP